MCDKAVSNELFLLKYYLDRYKIQGVCDEVVHGCLLALKFVTDWLVTSKIIKKLDDALFVDDDIIFINEDFNSVTFGGGEMDILSADLDKINLHDTIFHARHMA